MPYAAWGGYTVVAVVKGNGRVEKKKGPKKPEKVAPLDEENASEAIEGNESTLNEGEDEDETETEPLKKVPENNLPLRDYVKLYGQLRKLDEQLNKEYEEEIRMLIHFELLVVVAATSRVEKKARCSKCFERKSL